MSGEWHSLKRLEPLALLRLLEGTRPKYHHHPLLPNFRYRPDEKLHFLPNFRIGAPVPGSPSAARASGETHRFVQALAVKLSVLTASE
jgi:hypothetical protein